MFYRYLFFVLNWESSSGIDVTKTVLIGYAPEAGSKSDKVTISTGLIKFRDALNKKVNDAQCINQFEELNFDHIKSWFKNDQ